MYRLYRYDSLLVNCYLELYKKCQPIGIWIDMNTRYNYIYVHIIISIYKYTSVFCQWLVVW